MKRLSFFCFITICTSIICVCCDGRSKTYIRLEKDVSEIATAIQSTDNCDDLQMLSFSILGFRSDLYDVRRNDKLSSKEKLTDEEFKTLENVADQLDKAWADRSDTLGCHDAWDDSGELRTSDEDDI